MRLRFVLLTVLLVVSSLLFVACGNSKEAKTGEGASVDKKDTVELEMYSWRTEDRGAYEKIIAKFEEENPGIHIKFQPYESTEYNTILTNALVAGSGPDIVQLRPYSGTKTIADNDYLTALDDLEGLKNIDETYLDAAKGSDGKVYGVPLTLNAAVIFYNENIFKEQGLEVPETWDELLEVSEKLKSKDIIPIAQGGRDAYLLSMVHGVIAPSSYKGNEFVDKVVEGKSDFKDPAFIDSIERMKQLEQYFPKDFIALSDDDAKALFYTEDAAMYINGDYRLETFEENIPDIPLGVISGLSFEKGGETPVTTWVDGSYGVVKNSKHQDEAMKFMEFMASQQFGQMFSDELNRLSAINGVEPEHPIVQQIAEASEKSSTPYLMLVHFGDGEPTTKTTFENALQGMYLGELTVDEVADETQENVERAQTK